MKESGLGQTTLTIQDDALAAQDLRNDFTNFDWSTPYNLQEITGVDKFAMERLALLADYTGTLNGIFNPSANRIHAVMSGNLRIPRVMIHTISAKTLTGTVLFSDYKVNRAAGGELTTQSPFSLSNGTAAAWT